MPKKKMPKLEAWLSGELSFKLEQLETFAKATHAPIGFFFLQEPPEEQMPIPDYRTMASEQFGRPSPDLLDTIYTCQQRQEWYRDFERSMGAEPLSFVGSARVSDDIVEVASEMQRTLGFDLEERRRLRTWADALRRFIELADNPGLLVMVSGVVGNNNRRELDPGEFRGFTLVDSIAPLVFINGADTKSAQMFTLAHELAHVWLGQTAVSDAQALEPTVHHIERWCNQVAAELLVPLEKVEQVYDKSNPLTDEMTRLARHFKVSTLVLLRRIYDAGGMTRDELWESYHNELDRLKALSKGSGGNFYLTQAARVSKRFARALLISTLEGQTTYTQAFRMLGVKKMATFRSFGLELGY